MNPRDFILGVFTGLAIVWGVWLAHSKPKQTNPPPCPSGTTHQVHQTDGTRICFSKWEKESPAQTYKGIRI